MQHFRGKLLGLVAAELTKLETIDLYKRLHNRIGMNLLLRNKGLSFNDANLEPKF